MSIPAIPKDYYGHKTELFLDNLCNQESDNLRDHKHQDEEKDIKEITLYENGEYATIFITSPGGVKQNYKTSIDISELVI